MKRQLLAVSCVLAMAAAPMAAMACGPEKAAAHMGRITAIDGKARTFTIQDAESGKAITFKASEEIMAHIQGKDKMVMVKYEEMGDGLSAVGVTF